MLSKKQLNKLVRKNEQEYNKRIYKSYISSDEWKEKRKRVLKFYPKCCRCFSLKGLNVHHSSYIRLQYEIPTDLVVLCHICHEEFHRRYGVKEKMKRKTYDFIKELNPKFTPRVCMPPDVVKNRTSAKHCKYCNSELVEKPPRKNPRTHTKNYFSKVWKCSKNCTHGVNYLFEEDKVYVHN